MNHLDVADRSVRRSVASVVALVLALTLGGLITIGSEPGSAVDHPISLYVNAVGWSNVPGKEGNPGPALAVTRGDHVIVNLTSEDGLVHGLFIDYNRNNLSDAGDYISPTTSSTKTFSFDPDRTGQFNYCDQFVLVNCGLWTTREPNRPPTATILAPTTGTSWTAGFAHGIAFNVSDPDGDSVTVVLSYSYGGGAGQGPIAGPFLAGANPNTYSWTPSGFHAPDTIVHLVARDPSALSVSVDSPAFEVDATVPTIMSTAPGRGATFVDRGTGIVVAWSEEMNPASGDPDAFGVQVQDGPWIAGTVSWSIGNTNMTFRPTTPLNAATAYEVHVNATARDSSDPGNPFAGDSWTFSTGSGTDTNRPTILAVQVNPPRQFPDAPVNLTADVQDNVAVRRVSAMITGPSSENVTMAHGSGTRWYLSRTFVDVGHYDVVVWATDDAGNAASQALGFDISPRGNPSIPAPASVTATSVDGSVEVTWKPVSLPGLSGYHVYRGDAESGPFTRLTISPLRPSDPTVYRDGPEPGRTYYYTVTTVTATGAESLYAPASKVTVPPYQPSPLLNPVPWAIAGVTLGVILGVLYGTIWRRKLA